MRQMFDFVCSACDAVTERYIDSDVRSLVCECGHEATRVIGMPTVKLEGITGAFPGAAEKWARVREDNARIKAARN